MLLRMFYDEKLAQASWLVGCAATGQALVVDPQRDVDIYLEAAERNGLHITHVTETHIHADFVSGARELAQRSAAQLYLSAEGGPDWQYAFAGEAGATLLRDGDTFRVGNIVIEAMHTPGHTPEHLAFLVTDGAGADAPMGVFTGDFVFVGDVGRPDLLERAAGVTGTMEAGARALFHSLQRFRELPDYLQVWPGHGAGSACGKALGAVPQSTVGYEKRFNWALAIDDVDTFVTQVLAGQPEPPRYFREMKRINRAGPPLLGGFRRPPLVPESRLAGLLKSGALVIDTRPAGAFAESHVPGTLNIPLNRSFNTWVGWLVPYDADFFLIVDDEAGPQRIDEAVRDLAMIGLDRVAGHFSAAAVQQWHEEGGLLDHIAEAGLTDIRNALAKQDALVLDVRGASEFQDGHLPGALNLPLGYLPQRLHELPRDRDIIVHCQAGGRSAIAASVLRAAGFQNVRNYKDGYAGWSLRTPGVAAAAA
jgi:hydroxyacylglutathione hydrolase